jgi:LmbE family N-acetylglucosaminyl deacetylase
MAERLAPVATAPRITSRPERPRGRARRVVRRLLVGALALVLLLAGTVATAHFLAIHRSAQEVRATALVPPELPARVLVVVARPGQELPMAGTLAALEDAGAEVALLSLTRGEAQPPALAFAADRLAGLRADELSRSAEVLGIDEVRSAEYPDGELLAAEPAEVQARIAEVIAETAPSAILTVSDTTGQDTDAQAVAAYALAAAQAEGSPVARVWTVTRGDRELDWTALAGGSVGLQRVPDPQVAVVMDAASTGSKGAAMAAHGTQGPDLVRATYPFADRVPAWAYFRFWDREYFALAWGQPLA